jgi:plastocyanin
MRIFAILVAALALALAGCGGGNEQTGGGGGTSTPQPSPAGGGGEKLALAAPADGTPAFEPSKLTAKAGTVTIDFDNPSDIPHAVEVEGHGIEKASQTVTGAKTAVTVDLKAGKYTFYCPVDSHRQQGMEGTLTVK